MKLCFYFVSKGTIEVAPFSHFRKAEGWYRLRLRASGIVEKLRWWRRVLFARHRIETNSGCAYRAGQAAVGYVVRGDSAEGEDWCDRRGVAEPVESNSRHYLDAVPLLAEYGSE